MASTEKKRTRDGRVTWQARYRDPAGHQRKRSFQRKTDAEHFLTGVEHSQLVGSYIDPAAGRLTVGQWSTRWLASQSHLKPSTTARYEGIVARHVMPTWGDVPLSGVSHADVAAWVTRLSASGLAGSTVRYIHRVLALILALAVKDGRLARNPAASVRLPKAARTEKRYLTHEQVAALAEAAGDRRLVVLALAYTGLRWGELAGLRVKRVDLMRRRIEVVEAVTEVRGHLSWGTPKNHQRRSVPIPRSLVDDLAVHMAGKGPDELVFTSTKGHVLRNLNFRRDVFDRAARSAGLDGLTPHELRHTAASLAVSAGASVKSVQRMLGHASAAMTLDVYSGLFDDDLDAVADRLDAARAHLRVPLVCPDAPVVPITVRETGA
jgi:integrase